MYITRPHERNDIHTTTTTPMSNVQTTPDDVRAREYTMSKVLRRRQAVQLALLVFGLDRIQDASATPIASSELQRRDGSGVSKQIWVPVLVFCILVFVIVILSSKSSIRRSIAGFALTGAAPTAGLGRTAAPREITAEQLAGTINGEGAPATTRRGARTPTATANAPVTTRRARQPRRTPSQMSVTSLPAYNKEPGEEELVIFRGRDMEDATMPAAIVRQSADNESSLSIDRSQVSRYSPMPTSPNSMPLLNPDDTYEGDLSMQSLPLPEGEDRPRRPSDTGSHDTSSLIRVETNNSTDSGAAATDSPDPQGEAPPYFEVVDHDTPEHNVSSPSTSPQPAPTPAEPGGGSASVNRRSGFRSLLNRMSIVSHPPAPVASSLTGHTRNDSSASALSNGRSSTSRASHRPSNSIFRTISRQRSTHTLASLRPSSPNVSNVRLTSPSLISLQSISAPLSHTLTRTEFTYPKSGPTPDQLRVISSREHVARFGVPYGEEAVRWASTSRVDLEPSGPPPGFEEVVGSPTEAGTTSSAGSEPGPGSGTVREGSSSTNNVAQAQSSSPDPQSTDTNTPSPLAQTSSSRTTATHDSPSVYGSTTVTSTTSTVKPSQPISEFGTLLAPSGPDEHASVRSTASYATAMETLRPSARNSPLGSVSFRSKDPSTASVVAPEAEEFYDADEGVSGAGSTAGTESGYQSALATPRIGGAHLLEPTDATVVPAKPMAKDTVVK